MSRQTEKTMKELNAFLKAQRPDGSGEDVVYIMDVKCGPLLGGSYLGKPGVVPAYHMNKTHWLGVLLDGSAADETVTELLDLSYSETQSRKRHGKSAG